MALEQNIAELKTSVGNLTKTVRDDLSSLDAFKTESAATIERLRELVSDASATASDVEGVVNERVKTAETNLDRRLSALITTQLSELKENAAALLKKIREGDSFSVLPENITTLDFEIRRDFSDVFEGGRIYPGTLEKLTLTTGEETPRIDLVVLAELPVVAPTTTRGAFGKIGFVSHAFDIRFKGFPANASRLRFRSVPSGTIQGRIQFRGSPIATPTNIPLEQDGSFDFPVECIAEYNPPSATGGNDEAQLLVELTPASVATVYSRIDELVPDIGEAGSYVFEVSKLNLKGKLLRMD